VQQVLDAIAEPHRRTILVLVAEHELSAGEIALRFTVSRPAVSQHLRVLREAGLVAERREGARRFYRMRPEGLDELCRFLDRFWDVRLADLTRAVVEEQERSRL
jgi:DNA-binding transcriptional ArsR family regulator